MGINKVFFHIFVHNPYTDKAPGTTLDGIGLYFQRDQTWWKPGKGAFTISLWRWIGMPLMKHLPCETYLGGFFNSFRIWLLRRFGAKIGKNVVELKGDFQSHLGFSSSSPNFCQ